MIPNHAQFIQAIKEKKKVWVKFYSKADNGVLEQVCLGEVLFQGRQRGSRTGLRSAGLRPEKRRSRRTESLLALGLYEQRHYSWPGPSAATNRGFENSRRGV